MKRNYSYLLVTAVMILALLAQSWEPFLRGMIRNVVSPQSVSAQTEAASVLAECHTIFLPAIITSDTSRQEVADTPEAMLTIGNLNGPDFEIITPVLDGNIAGMTYFAVQPIDVVTSVSFQAGLADLGTDATPGDGFKVFLDASILPAGPLTLTATAANHCGSTTKSINVNVVADPPSSAVIGSEGGVLASDIGSIITLPPGAVPHGTTVTVTEKTQEGVTAENGLNWEAMGVTFLGAQEVNTGVPFSLPLSVASAGFGNRVQPGQVVVNYRVAPDADGDGVDELIVVNTASVAPNDDVISDPIPKPIVSAVQTQSSLDGFLENSQAEAISGAPGTIIQMDVSGFNPFSAYGNVAIFRSSVDETVVELPGTIVPDFSKPSATDDQLFVTVIPPITPGPAKLFLRNESTGYQTEAVEVIIEEASPLQSPARETIDDYLALLPNVIDELDISTYPADSQSMFLDWKKNLNQEILEYTTVLDQLDESNKDVQDFLNTFASMIETSNLLTFDQIGPASTRESRSEIIAAGLGSIATGAAVAAGNSAISGLLTAHTELTAAVAAPIVGWLALGLIAVGTGILFGTALRGLVNALTGMGAAPPAGGSGGGVVSGSGLGATGSDYIIQLISSGSRLPFSGMTDPGGYFAIPLIPAGEPFTALAIDTSTGDTRSLTGVGPAVGDSTYLFFDFLRESEPAGTPINIGQVVTGVISTTADVHIYSFEATAGQTVFIDKQSASGKVHWQVVDQLGNVIVNQNLSPGSDPGLRTLEHDGDYIITVSSPEDGGTYQFQIWNVPPPDVFAINIGDVISDGSPGPGAGKIETSGVKDIYNFSASNDQTVFFDIQHQSGLTQVNWKLIDEDGTIIFDNNLGGGDPSLRTLSRGGTYTITVGENRDNTGIYQFQIWNVPPPDIFAINIGDVISDGSPGPGAGKIETPGVKDIYNFSASNDQTVFFDIQHQSGLTQVNWKVTDEDGTIIFDNNLGGGDPGLRTLSRGGTYTITVGESRDDTGIYQFQIWNVPPPDVFAINIGDVISDGSPGPGAGKIETPGVKDIYNFSASNDQTVFFDIQHQSDLTQVNWKVTDEDGTIIFDNNLGGGDPGLRTLSRGGTYTITVGESRDDTGIYQFQIWNVPPPDIFAINIGDVISDGSPGPGAGKIETSGVKDIYNFSASNDQTVFFDIQHQSGLTQVNWKLIDEDGTIIFDNNLGGGDPSLRTLSRGGTYTITVGENRDNTGIYQFQIWNVPPPDIFAINIGDVISDGSPGPGAGKIETPGVKDIYNFSASNDQTVFFDIQHQSGLTQVNWKVTDEDGTIIFDNNLGGGDPGLRTLSRGGTYTITVGESRDDTGIYQFQIWNVPPPDVFAINIGDVISDGSPGPGAGKIETPGVKDIYNFSASNDQTVFFDIQHQSGLTQVNWKVTYEDGTIIFDNNLGGGDPGLRTLSRGGTYTITVGESRDDTGIYQFQIWNVPPPDVFAINIGDIISPGVPGPGAGVIETPAVQDIYNFSATPGQSIFFDVQNQSGLTQVNWKVVDEDGTIIFDTCLGCGDPGLRTLSRGGTYTITVGENRDDTGTYQYWLEPR